MADRNATDGVKVVDKQPWELAHQTLVGFARKRAGLDLEEGKWLLAAARERVDRRLGYASFVEYIERLFGYTPRLTQEKLRVADALEQLPELATALQKAEICWSSVRELTRVATRETEKVWMGAAQGASARDVERMVSGRTRGSLPTDPADDRLRRHVLRFEVSGEVMATFRDAIAKLRREAGGTLDDDAALLLMARQVLAGPLDEGRASYQIEVSICEECRQVRQQGGGERIEVSAEIADMARCDAQHVPTAHVGGAVEAHPRAKQDTPPALRRQVLRRDRRRCSVPGCQHHTFLDLHHICPRAAGGGHEADNLITLCGAHHRAAHRGELCVEGRVDTGLSFKHADGSDYGAAAAVAAPTADAQAKAFRALRHLGFNEREVRQALSKVCESVGEESGVELRLRAALEQLTAQAFRRAS